MYFKLAIKNVKKSYQDYLIYFLTLMFSVAIFYAFNSFDNQSIILDLDKMQRMLIQILRQVMSVLSVVVAIVCGFLILYANSFLVKRRKKELGLYTMLGMKRKNISRILVYETFIIGVVSLVSGLFLGYILSQGMTLLTAKILVVSVNYQFVFSINATALTIASFLLIFLIVMVFNAQMVGRYQLIDLLKSDRMNQELKLKSSFLSIALFLCSLILIGTTYWIGLTIGIKAISIIVLLGSLGTFLLFYSLSGFLLRFIQMRKKMYYKDLNMFILRQINTKINATFASMSVVCLMLLVSIGAIATGFNLNHFARNEIDSFKKFDTTIHYTTVKEESLKFYDLITYNRDKVKKDYYFTQYQSNILMSQLVPFVEDKDMKSDLDGSQLEIGVIPLSEYNQVMSAYEGQYLELKPHEGALHYQGSSLKKLANQIQNATLNAYGEEVKIVRVMDGKHVLSLINDITFSVIVNDDEIPDDVIGERFWSMKLKDSEKNQAFVDEMEVNINKYQRENPENPMFPIMDNTVFDNKIMTSRASIEASASAFTMMLTYIGLYLGATFLMSSVVILALQQLSEASDNQKRYQILSKMGVSKKMINRSIWKQISIYFFIPLFIAGIHATVGIYVVLNEFTQTLGMTDVIVPTLVSIAIILFIYLLYFYITYSSSKTIINGKNK